MKKESKITMNNCEHELIIEKLQSIDSLCSFFIWKSLFHYNSFRNDTL